MRHYPHPYKETPERGPFSALVLLVALGAVLAGSWRVFARAQHRRVLRATGARSASVGGHDLR